MVGRAQEGRDLLEEGTAAGGTLADTPAAPPEDKTGTRRELGDKMLGILSGPAAALGRTTVRGMMLGSAQQAAERRRTAALMRSRRRWFSAPEKVGKRIRNQDRRKSLMKTEGGGQTWALAKCMITVTSPAYLPLLPWIVQAVSSKPWERTL